MDKGPAFSFLLGLIAAALFGHGFAQDDYDYVFASECHDQAMLQYIGALDDLPVIHALARARSYAEVEQIVDESRPTGLCRDVTKILHGVQEMVHNIDVECRPVVFEGRFAPMLALTYEDTVTVLEKLITMAESTCNNDLKFLEQSFDCLNDRRLFPKFTRCTEHNPCTHFAEFRTCFEAVLDKDSTCGSAATQHFSLAVISLREAMDIPCQRIFGGEMELLLHRFIKRLVK